MRILSRGLLPHVTYTSGKTIWFSASAAPSVTIESPFSKSVAPFAKLSQNWGRVMAEVKYELALDNKSIWKSLVGPKPR